MIELKNHLKSHSIVYVTRDIERALGLPLSTKGYFVVSNYSDFNAQKYKNKKNVLLIDSDKPLSTHDLLQHQDSIDFIKKLENPQIVVFKNNLLIEKVCKKNNFELLNPSAKFSAFVEEKITQIEWLNDLNLYLPPFQIKTCKELAWRGEPFILQFNSAHTGTGTFLIESDEELKQIQKKFPRRPAKATKYIAGPMFTSNNVVSKNQILCSNISYQITGLAPFTDNHYATIGNDWKLPKKFLNKTQKKQFLQIADDVGEKLAEDGWKGLFGIDVILDKSTGKLFLIEINARQPASTTFEAQLQASIKVKVESRKLTIFEAHLASLLELDLDKYKLIKIKSGAQIVQRKTKYIAGVKSDKIKKLKSLGLTLFYHDRNAKIESDQLRIQTDKSFMKDHNGFNRLGRKLL